MFLIRLQKETPLNKTPEPGPEKKTSDWAIFLSCKSIARPMHYDFRSGGDRRFEIMGRAKGPPMDPNVEASGHAVEDHPVDYADFEG